jgi:Fic family protein
MVYHEVRKEYGKIKNYLVYGMRNDKKLIKKSKFIGYGNISKKQVENLKNEFIAELIRKKEYKYLSREQVRLIEELKNVYNKKISQLSKEEFEEFENSFFTELTYNSNAIEGSSLSLEETSLVINENLVPSGKTLREVYEAKNHIEAIKFIENHKGDLNEKFVLELHSIVLKGISEKFAGKYRENPVRIFGSDVRFPDAEKVPQLMKNIFYWYKKNKKNYHPFELAVVMSMKFVTIHPFIDGNGRISRLLMNFVLKKKKYPWVNVYIKQRAEYLFAVRKANDEDYSLIIPFLVKTLRENLESFGFFKS